MAEILRCYETCPFVKNGIVRPCSKQVFEATTGTCAQNIEADPAFAGQGLHVETSMNNLMYHAVSLKEGKKLAAVVTGGFVKRENIAGYV